LSLDRDERDVTSEERASRAGLEEETFVSSVDQKIAALSFEEDHLHRAGL
jgi:hypothetical protein